MTSEIPFGAIMGALFDRCSDLKVDLDLQRSGVDGSWLLIATLPGGEVCTMSEATPPSFSGAAMELLQALSRVGV